MNVIDKITKKQMKENIPDFRVGDTVRVDVKIIEGKRHRVQVFEGIVMARKGEGISETFTVRKKSGSYGVERIFPIHSPVIDKIVVIRHGRVRRAKLNFVRELKGQYRSKEKNSNIKKENKTSEE